MARRSHLPIDVMKSEISIRANDCNTDQADGSKRKRRRPGNNKIDSCEIPEPSAVKLVNEESNSEHISESHSNWVIAVHGGAAQGYLSEATQKKYRECMKEACRQGAAALERGCSAEDAVL
jgi:hypothetical protein